MLVAHFDVTFGRSQSWSLGKTTYSPNVVIVYTEMPSIHNTDEKFKKTYQTVERPVTTNKNINDVYYRNAPNVCVHSVGDMLFVVLTTWQNFDNQIGDTKVPHEEVWEEPPLADPITGTGEVNGIEVLTGREKKTTALETIVQDDSVHS